MSLCPLDKWIRLMDKKQRTFKGPSQCTSNGCPLISNGLSYVQWTSNGHTCVLWTSKRIMSDGCMHGHWPLSNSNCPQMDVQLIGPLKRPLDNEQSVVITDHVSPMCPLCIHYPLSNKHKSHLRYFYHCICFFLRLILCD